MVDRARRRDVVGQLAALLDGQAAGRPLLDVGHAADALAVRQREPPPDRLGAAPQALGNQVDLPAELAHVHCRVLYRVDPVCCAPRHVDQLLGARLRKERPALWCLCFLWHGLPAPAGGLAPVVNILQHGVSFCPQPLVDYVYSDHMDSVPSGANSRRGLGVGTKGHYILYKRVHAYACRSQKEFIHPIRACGGFLAGGDAPSRARQAQGGGGHRPLLAPVHDPDCSSVTVTPLGGILWA